MAGSVKVLADPGGWVVGCFRTDCPEHGDGTYAEPWVSEHRTRRAADTAARAHRLMIRNAWEPDRCTACGQRVPRRPDPAESNEESA